MTIRELAKATAVHVSFAFLAMGGWTLWANAGHGLAAAWIPALVQGAISGTITLVLKRALEAMAARLGGPAAYVVPPLATASVIAALLVGVHTLIGTPEIARTIAVPWSVSSLYAIIYTSVLVRGRIGAKS
ncbi:hypothetical protein [Phenylobacterium sp.]|jgi:hypothetical protein|uniref:hypothetical protein n=1 Tax=Phenylobacterium sp. TaxID=1871053 RepID=UPI002F3F35DF